MQVVKQRKILTLSTELANYQSDNFSSQPSLDSLDRTLSQIPKRICAWISLKSLSLINTITSKVIVIDLSCRSAEVYSNTMKSCTPPDRTIWNHSRVGTPGFNIDFFSPSRGNNSSFAKWTRNIKPLDNSVDGSATQERNSYFLCI